jgi:hypothetical protein
MRTFLFIVEPIVFSLGSLAAGIFSCWLLFAFFNLMRRPDWGPPLILVPVILALAGRLPDSEFVKMSLVFALVAAVPFWAVGREWRAARLNRGGQIAPVAPAGPNPIKTVEVDDTTTAQPYRRYPAITACICESRPPSRDEVKKVAARIWRESFAVRSPNASFALRRALLRAAKTSLNGSQRIAKPDSVRAIVAA